ncbi:hypothetical protein [Streptomyces sp. VB1]|uniref:hypothetical protein n=1 Tax=Streptomyces sp. VB1 TaxID=2986803 RepID=UPI002241B514|nr:hypothetical protein [Streptomyces sp. VB1]UZI27171.1 hypothetical protein OH133_03045 [Streptomyces sp. VB1]
MIFEEEQAYMRRATTPAAATIALRGLLVLLVAVVSLLCLVGRSSPQPQGTPPSSAISVAQAAAATAVPVSPCLITTFHTQP